MPKLKTHKGAQKRFHITGTGKILRSRGPKSHLRRNKSKAMKRQLDAKVPVFKGDIKRIQRLISHGV